MFIKKVKIAKNKEGKETIHIEWERTVAEQTGEYQLTEPEPARPELYKALDGLKQYVIDICDLPEDFLNGMRVTGVSFSNPDTRIGASIIAQKTLKINLPFHIITPHLFSKPKKKDVDGAPFLTEPCMKVLRMVIAEAEKYIDGERAQTKLPFNEKNGDR